MEFRPNPPIPTLNLGCRESASENSTQRLLHVGNPYKRGSSPWVLKKLDPIPKQ